MTADTIKPRTSVAVVPVDGFPSVTSMFRFSEAKALGFGAVVKMSSHAGELGFRDCMPPDKVAGELAKLPPGTVVVVPRSRRLTFASLESMAAPASGTVSYEPKFEDCGAMAMLRDDAVAWASGGGAKMAPVPAAKFADLVDRDTSGGRPQCKGRIIVGLASYPARERGMLSVVAALSPQCDEMHVSLNEYSGEKLKSVLGKLSAYRNVVAKAYTGEDDLGCQNKFRAVDLCGPDDYLLTVDDDVTYPYNYVATMVKHCRSVGGTAIVSCSGCLFPVNRDGTANLVNCAKYVPTEKLCTQMRQMHSVGNATACCMPARIGLSFQTFMFPKNSGDDEILALFTQSRGIKSFVVPHADGWVNFMKDVSKISPVSGDPVVCAKRRLSVMGLWDDWRLVGSAMPKRVLFHIVTPHYNDPELLSRCLDSVASQNIDKSKIHMTVVDDCSDDEKARKAAFECGRYGFVSFMRLQSRSMAGGARNAGLDAGVDSEYTVFLDSDDMFMNRTSLSTLESEILSNNRPDVILCGFVFDNTGNVRMFNADTPERMSVAQCIAPWIRVSKSGLVPRFPESRRMSEDVVQFLRHVDSVETVASTKTTIFRYMSDNPLSGWNSSLTMRSRDAIKARFLVVSDILSESFKHDYTKRRAVSQLKSEAKCAADLVIAMRDEDLIRL